MPGSRHGRRVVASKASVTFEIVKTLAEIVVFFFPYIVRRYIRAVKRDRTDAASEERAR